GQAVPRAVRFGRSLGRSLFTQESYSPLLPVRFNLSIDAILLLDTSFAWCNSRYNSISIDTCSAEEAAVDAHHQEVRFGPVSGPACLLSRGRTSQCGSHYVR